MKKHLSILFLLCFVFSINAQDVYEDALTAASYAYSHSKKAHAANNVFHTQEYADKAIVAFEKVESLSKLCGCTTANEKAYEAIDDLQSALDEDTFERSRFYVKRAKENGEQILSLITECEANNGNGGALASTDEMQYENEAIANAAEEINKQQLALEEKQKQLEAQQVKLNQQIALQEKKQKEFEAERSRELEEQRTIKSKAELALQNLESALLQFNVVFNKDESEVELQNDYLRSKNDLENESLNETKNFYVNRAKELTKSAMKQFANYNEDE